MSLSGLIRSRQLFTRQGLTVPSSRGVNSDAPGATITGDTGIVDGAVIRADRQNAVNQYQLVRPEFRGYAETAPDFTASGAITLNVGAYNAATIRAQSSAITITLAAPPDLPEEQEDANDTRTRTWGLTLRIVWAGAGSRTVTFSPTVKTPDGDALEWSTASGGIDVLVLVAWPEGNGLEWHAYPVGTMA